MTEEPCPAPWWAWNRPLSRAHLLRCHGEQHNEVVPLCGCVKPRASPHYWIRLYDNETHPGGLCRKCIKKRSALRGLACLAPTPVSKVTDADIAFPARVMKEWLPPSASSSNLDG